MQSSFIDSIKRLYMVFDGEPFKLPKTRRPSRPLYDALMIALSINPGLDVENRKSFVVDKLASALANEESYEILIGRGNTIEAVRQRILLAIEILSA